MSWFFLGVLGGLLVLVWSADRFVAGAAGLARALGVSTLIIGLTVVAFGTSAPEMLVSAVAALQGNSGLAIGNAIGSNIANMALVLGVTAIIAPLAVHSNTLNREFPLMLIVMVAALGLLWNGMLSRMDGLLLLTGMVMVVLWTIHLAHTSGARDPLIKELAEEIPAHMPTGKAWWLLTSGLVLLLGSSKLLVWGAVGIAQYYGVSDLVIGLTIVAIGTSLPELAASIMAARKNEHDIAVGNVVGSNLFNIMAVLGIAGTIAPTEVEEAVLYRDFPLMLALSVVLYLVARGFSRKGHGIIRRWAGLVLLAVFLAYQTSLFLSVKGTAG
ncbi:calcium/sodium antiporter [Thiolapillus brandeum]|uniref:Na+/Ca+ antiporter, CaCA family n=1 Tax=Thiolapillus brandeum TaxID=1076588 RepID=A0A7U6GJ29_9GAMM|nr:calcium/sodium antiporter [Thiolapillus brandeum]BAO44561.1 Na+/Ca+ antiporter, CaCA family [Thiolapillus brandeum]